MDSWLLNIGVYFFSETLSRDNKRKKIERCEKEKDKDYKRIKHYDESKEKSPDQ